jgi:hypothetical protein
MDRLKRLASMNPAVHRTFRLGGVEGEPLPWSQSDPREPNLGEHHAHSSLASRHSHPDHHPPHPLFPLSAAMSSTLDTTPPALAYRSGISWGPVLGGAVVATAVTVLLVAIGTGLGFASVSPASGSNPSPTTFTVLAAIWLLVVQWISSFFGGYLAGRLRPGWGGVHKDEVVFRDTACGFAAWAVASLFIVAMVSSGASSLVGGAGRAAASAVSSVAGGAAQSVGASSADPTGYLLDSLFRPASPSPQANSADVKAEAGRILGTAAVGDISQPDHDYLVAMVASRTGLSSADAGKRVDDVIGKEKQAIDTAKKAADTARKAASSLALYTGFSMLVGAFIACVAGAIGGRQRDAY